MDKVNDILQCPICLDRFKEPKGLPCQHTFCLTCLEKTEREYVSSIKCPTCRTSHTLPSGGVKRLPSNHTMVQLLDIPLSGNCSDKPLYQLETSLERMNIEREKTQLERDLKQMEASLERERRMRMNMEWKEGELERYLRSAQENIKDLKNEKQRTDETLKRQEDECNRLKTKLRDEDARNDQLQRKMRDLQRSSHADSSNRSRSQICGIIVDHSPRLIPGPMSLFGPGIGVGIHHSRAGSLFDDELTFVTDDAMPCFLPF